MKKSVFLFLILVLSVSLYACGGGRGANAPDTISTGEPPTDDKTPTQTFDGSQQQPATRDTGSASVYLKLYDAKQKAAGVMAAGGGSQPPSQYEIGELLRKKITSLDFSFYRTDVDQYMLSYYFSVNVIDGVVRAEFNNLQVGSYSLTIVANNNIREVIFYSTDNIIQIRRGETSSIQASLKIADIPIDFTLKNFPFPKNFGTNTAYRIMLTFFNNKRDCISGQSASIYFNDNAFTLVTYIPLTATSVRIGVCDNDFTICYHSEKYIPIIPLEDAIKNDFKWELNFTPDGGGNVDINFNFEYEFAPDAPVNITVVVIEKPPLSVYPPGNNLYLGKIGVLNTRPEDIVFKSMDVVLTHPVLNALRLYQGPTRVSPDLAAFSVQGTILYIDENVIIPAKTLAEFELYGDIPTYAAEAGTLKLTGFEFIGANSALSLSVTPPNDLTFNIVTK